jgi:hypothetical protein
MEHAPHHLSSHEIGDLFWTSTTGPKASPSATLAPGSSATYLYAYAQLHILHRSTRNRTLAALEAQLLSLVCQFPEMKVVAH